MERDCFSPFGSLVDLLVAGLLQYANLMDTCELTRFGAECEHTYFYVLHCETVSECVLW